jgi:hypothetical protein
MLLSYYGDVAAYVGASSTTYESGRIRIHGGARVVTAEGTNVIAPAAGVEIHTGKSSLLGVAIERRYQFQGNVEEPASFTIRPFEVLLRTQRSADVVGGSLTLGPASIGPAKIGLFRIEGFSKRYHNQVHLLGRRYGESDLTYAARFPDVEPVPGTAVGALLSTSVQLGSRLRYQASYTLQRVRQTYGGETAPTSWDIPQQTSMFASFDLSRRWTLDAVYQAHTGIPLTPVAARILVPGSNTVAGPGFASGERNSLRTPMYQRLDLSAQRKWRTRGGKEWTLSLHVLNALRSTNPIGVDWDQYYAWRALQLSGVSRGGSGEFLQPSLPLLPSIGVRVQW